MKKLFLSAMAVAMLALGIVTLLPAETRTAPASAQQSDKYDGDCTGNETVGRCADKPVCQYPDRWSNPPGGCDNSDPAVPECIKAFSTKAGEDACIAAFVAEHEPVQVSEPLTPMEGK